MSKVRTNDGYKDIEAVYAGNIPIDTIYDKNGNILFSAYNEVSGVSPLSFRSKSNNSSTLKNYRIYGKSSKNLFDYNSWKNVITGVTNSGTITFNSNGSFTITSGETADVYTLPTTASNAFRCPVKGNTTYTFSFSSNNSTNGLIYLFENGINDSDHKHIAFNQTAKSVTFTTQSDTTYINVRFGVYSANSSITYKEVQLVEGEQIIEYEPYGESVGDKTNNLFDGEWTQGSVDNAGNIWEISQNRIKTIVSVIPSQMYTIRTNLLIRMIFAYNDTTEASGKVSGLLDAAKGVEFATITIPNNANLIVVSLMSSDNSNITPSDVEWTMLNVGSTALPYEPYGYKVPVKIAGKNLLNFNDIESGRFDFSTGEKVYDSSQLRTASPIKVEPQNSYVISGIKPKTQIRAFMYDEEMAIISTTLYSNNSVISTTASTAFLNVAGIQNAWDAQIQLEKNSTATSYEPYHAPTTTNLYLPEQIKMVGDESEYIDFKEQKQYRVRKNLIQNICTSRTTTTGLTITVNSDKSVIVDGTTNDGKASGIAIGSNTVIGKGTFIISGCPEGGSYDTYRVAAVFNDGGTQKSAVDMGNGASITLTSDDATIINNGFYLMVKSCDNKTFYPMIRRAEIADGTYEPYIIDTELDVTLPSISIPSGTNTLSVETEVQPSDIYLKGKIEKKPKIYYYSQDGQTLLYTEAVLKGSNGLYSGTPTKTADPQYTYTFAGWADSTGQTSATSGVRNNIQSDTNVYAAFSQTLNTYTVYFYNESDTPIETVYNVTYGGSATYSGATPTKTGTSTKEYIFTGWSPSPTNISGNTSCYAQYVELTQTITDSWQEILESSTDGTYTSKYAVGDTKIIDLGTEGKVAMEIVGIDTDDLSDNSGKAPITWISKQVLNVFHRMNPRYRAGVEGTGALGGWEKTEMRNYLKETIKPLIPSVVRNNISSVKKYTICYNVSEQRVSNVLTIEDVWIPSKQEVSPNGDFSYESSGVYYPQAFPNTESRIKKRVKVPGTIFWWLRTAAASGYFSEVYSVGTFSSDDAGNMRGVVLGFCTGKLPIYTITYKSQDGQTTVYTENVIQGKNGVYDTAPTKSSTAQYDYTFAGWSTSANSTTATSGATQNIQSDKVVYAAFTETIRSYTVTFYNGQTSLGTSSVNYGSNAVYSGETPTKASTQQYEYYFLGWNTNPSATTADADALANVTSDRTVYAIFAQTTRTYTVTFYNENTVLETVSNVPCGGTATYTGSTPTKTDYTFTGWSPEPTNISGDTSCYAQFEAVNTGLITDSWETIASRAAAGTAQNYYSVGDHKEIELNGTMGTVTFDHVQAYVTLYKFNHNSSIEGTGITFIGFTVKDNTTNEYKNVALTDSYYDTSVTDGTKAFNINHWNSKMYGGWKGCDLRYDILGGTDVAPSEYGQTKTSSNVGYDATSNCAISPVANTLMSCLPIELRRVIKPMIKYTDNVGGTNVEASVTSSIDYLSLLSFYEDWADNTYKIPNEYEANYQLQYHAGSSNNPYYDGYLYGYIYNYNNLEEHSLSFWYRSPSRYVRSPSGIINTGTRKACDYSYGIVPIFLVNLQTYTVSYYSQDGLTLLGTETVNNGHNAQGLAQNPTKASDTDYDYIFAGWNSQGNKTAAEANILNSITQNKTVYAAFEPAHKSDTISDSWEDIIESCSDGTYSSKYSVGDLKTIDLGSEGIIQMEIVGIDADDKADNSGKAPITWISKQLLYTYRRMNPYFNAWEEGTGTVGGFEKSEMRTYLKDDIKPLIPEIVRNNIKSVNKYSTIYNTSYTDVNDVLSTEDIWIPSYKEVFGSGRETEGVTYSSAFPNDSSRTKETISNINTGTYDSWWLRTAGSRECFDVVGSWGGYTYTLAYTNEYIAFGFCT